AYSQWQKMSALAQQAHECGAVWVWPFDADELWYYGAVPLAAYIEAQTADVLYARRWHHFCTDAAPADGNPFQRMQYRGPDEAPIGKVIIRWKPGTVIEQGNHGAAMMANVRHLPTDIQVRHFPYRSADQFTRKAINGSRAYAATTLPPSVGQHWREYGKLYDKGGQKALKAAFDAHFFYDLPSASGLVYDPARLDS